MLSYTVLILIIFKIAFYLLQRNQKKPDKYILVIGNAQTVILNRF